MTTARRPAQPTRRKGRQTPAGLFAPASSRPRSSSTRSWSTTRAGWRFSASPASTWRGRTISSSSSRVSPRAGRPTKTARSGRSRSARASRSTTARRSPPRMSPIPSTSTRIRRTRGTRSPHSGIRAASRREARRRSTTPRSWSRSTARTEASPTSSARTTTTSSSSPTASIPRRGRSRSWERAPGFSTRSRRSRA